MLVDELAQLQGVRAQRESQRSVEEILAYVLAGIRPEAGPRIAARRNRLPSHA